MSTNLPNCYKCTHYFITYEPAKPYGCRAMRFKSNRNPARVVYESSGIICQLFTPKKKIKPDGSGGGGFSRTA
ncbi:uracil-DNA glycosylase [Desulfosediminicola flagellatus]|uniref:uracil-DNA glycosylase n=1 Tax=Desulfosediminicola flagellatus TaxID=2569541 RepID=UPI0010ACEAD4|nr:uracil-DNA glycosylase [Desulfosediminicola flagellatus]